MGEVVRKSGEQELALSHGGAPRRADQRRHRQVVARRVLQADLETIEADLAAEVGRVKVQAVASVSGAAMTAAALLVSRERMLIETEPAAITAVAYLGQRATLALGVVIDDVLAEVTR